MKILAIIIALLLVLSLGGCSVLTSFIPQSAATTEPTVPETTEAATRPPVTGWVEENGKRFYHDESGIPVTGWVEIDRETYYFHPDGTAAAGETVIDGITYHFTSQGRRIILVNPWNSVPADYVPDLVPLEAAYGVEGSLVDRSCYDALTAMLRECNRVCPEAIVVSSYRSHEHQTANYNRKVQYYLDQGYSRADAEKEAATIVAVPGTSEHQLGLAVDIIDSRLWALEWEQADLPAQQWLMENCWKYGFILRYPKDKIEITGIIYEPWHYRYVGEDVSTELHESGLTLEEYIQSLTN